MGGNTTLLLNLSYLEKHKKAKQFF